MLDHASSAAAGIDGVMLAVDATGQPSGRVDVGVDYSSFAQAFGGNYGQRLHLVQLPSCALTTPAVPGCRQQTPLKSANTPATHLVSAQVTVGAAAASTVLAAVAGVGQEGGPAGSYGATSLKPSGFWNSGSSTGSFSYSYPITVPPAASPLVPNVALAYDSSSVDGQTSSSQVQSSWVGDGWSTPSSFIEQSFVSCADSPEGTAAPNPTTDMCYDGAVLTLSLNGSSVTMVQDDATHKWRPQTDNGEVITHLENTNNGTGTYNTDYWTVTTRDGTTYQFGRNQLPGYATATTKVTSDSVDSMPVYSSHSGDPCFTQSYCTMAYRWNLDYVSDIHGNAMSYYYLRDTNKYAQNKGALTATYIRDSHLDHIDYGFTAGNAYSTAPNRVNFKTDIRCTATTGCGPLSATTKANWKDVPFDLVCTGSTCTQGQRAPSFFSTVRLKTIETQQYSITAKKYVTVDSYALSQSMPKTGDGTSETLWLDSIVHTASGDSGLPTAPAPVTLPPVTFAQSPAFDLPNRVNPSGDGYPALQRFRIASITTETGSVITPTYTLKDPCTDPAHLTPATNTKSCYPVYWTPEALSTPILDWFNKYVVTRVQTTDPTGGAPPVVTDYDYLGGAAWHHDDNELVKAKYRTYGEFRGYGKVQTREGGGVNDGGNQTLSETTYYRGMSRNNGGAALALTDSQGGAHDDTNTLAGAALETTEYLGDGGPVDNTTITSYWVSGNTAKRDRPGLPALTANWTAPAETYVRQAVTSSGATTWRATETDNTYLDDVGTTTIGLLTRSYSHTVPAVAAYDQCTTNTYAAPNTAAGVNLVGLIAEAETDAVACGGFQQAAKPSAPAALNSLTAPGTVNRPDQVVNDVRTFYNDPNFSTAFPQPAPANDNITMIRTASDWAAGSFSYTTSSRFGYDTYGRVKTQWDANNSRVDTTFTMNTVGLTTATTTTNILNQSVTTTVDTQRGQTLTSTDANGIVNTQQYDALGRNAAIWLNSRPIGQSANLKFTYQTKNNGITAATTSRLNGSNGYATSTLIYDAMLRPRQTQATIPQPGRMVTDTIYDSRGWVASTNNGWWDPSTSPNTVLIQPATLNPKPDIPNADVYTYDGLGRVVRDDSTKSGLTVSSTTTVYNGDRTTIIPPTGGVVTTTLTDPIGRTSELDQYTAAPTVHEPANTFTATRWLSGGTVTAIKYGFDARGNQNTITDAENETWISTFNLLGEVVTKQDPDAGKTSMSYDPGGNLQQITDSRNKTVSYAYDSLSRRIGAYNAPSNNQNNTNQFAKWVYDNSDNAVLGMSNPIGHQTSSTAFHEGAAYTTQSAGFNVFGESTGDTVTIPKNAEGDTLGTSYSFTHTYKSLTGLPFTDVYPAAGGLPQETVVRTYGGVLDLPKGLGGTNGYVQNLDYDAFGRITTQTLGETGKAAQVTDGYDPHTGQLKTQAVAKTVPSVSDLDRQAYDYDLVGKLKSQVSTRLGTSTPTETQCYGYDSLNRLSQAWTATDACDATPTSDDHSTVGDNLGAASAYWTSWTFNTVGDRDTQTQHGIGTTSDTTTKYTYDDDHTGQAHTLTATHATGANTDSTSYKYDAAGNMTARHTPDGGDQTLSWDGTGALTSVTGQSGTTSYIYDADGNVLLQKDPGKTTLYLPGEQITLDTNLQTVSGVRYYQLPGGGTAIRTGAGTNYTFEITDQHGTPTVYLDNTAQQPTWRQYTPYGADRGAHTSVPDNRGFLNAPDNANTGLTQLGARNYDPSTGRFISVDPILDPADSQQLNGYGYSDSDPINKSDPNGLRPDCGNGSAFDTCDNTAPAASGSGHPGWTNNHGASSRSHTSFENSYHHISNHVVIKGSDPRYHDMDAAWRDALQHAHVGANGISRSQELGIWHQICVVNPETNSICGDRTGFAKQLNELSDGAPADDNTIWFLGDDFKSTGGSAAIVILQLFYKPDWSAEQRAEADAKVKAYNSSDLIVSESKRSGSARAKMKAAGKTILFGQDADHVIDLQLGGRDEAENIEGLNSSVNRSLGSQVRVELKRNGLKLGDRVDGVTIGEIWNGPGGRGGISGGGAGE